MPLSLSQTYNAVHVNKLFLLPLNTHGTWMADNINGTALDDTVYGGYGNDTIHGNAGDDYINGEEMDDVLYGDAGNDVVVGGAGNDWVYGGDGNDLVKGDDDFGAQGNDWVFGGNGNDNMFGMGGNDALFGEAGNDSIGGGAGDDLIVGGAGRDYLRGDAGNDTFIFAVGDSSVGTSTSDHITDFAPFWGGDRIDVNDYVMSHATMALSGRYGSIEAAAGAAFSLQQFGYGNAGSALISDQATGNAYLLLDQNGDHYFETGVVLDGGARLDVSVFASHHELMFS